MLRIDSIEPIITEAVGKLIKLQSDVGSDENKVLDNVIDSLQYIVRELDTCISLVCQERDNKEF